MSSVCSKSESRRGFFGKSVAGGISALAGVYLAMGSKTSVQAQRPGGGGFLSPERFISVRNHERAHVAGLVTLIESKGGVPRPKPTFTGLLQDSFNAFTSVGRVLENTGVGAYYGAIPSITDGDILEAAGGVALIEARHAGYFNVLLNFPITDSVKDGENLDPDVRDNPNFEGPLTDAQVRTLAGPFIADLNGGPPVAYGTAGATAAQVDIEVLNFALALEYLEREFYDLNVARFFGQ